MQNVIFDEGKFHVFEKNRAVKNVNKADYLIFPIEELPNSCHHTNNSVPVPLGSAVSTTQNDVVDHQEQTDNDNATEESEEVGDSGGRIQVGDLVGEEGVRDHAVNNNERSNVMSTYEETFMRNVSQLPDKRTSKPNSRYLEELNIVNESIDNKTGSLLCDIDEPKNIKGALNGTHAAQWKEAMDSEYTSLVKNKTWALVPRPKGMNIVGCRWVYKLKRDGDGSINRFKARLVAQGFSQTHGVD